MQHEVTVWYDGKSHCQTRYTELALFPWDPLTLGQTFHMAKTPLLSKKKTITPWAVLMFHVSFHSQCPYESPG